MPNQLDAVANQMKNTAKTVARSETAKVTRQTSLVRVANTKVSSTLSGIGKKKESKMRKSGVYTGATRAYISRDGYVRRSPVQEIRVPEGYTRRLVVKAVVALAVAAVAVVLAVTLIKYLF